LAMLAAKGEREPDDHLLGVVLGDQLGQPGEPLLGARALDDADGTRNRPGWVRDGDAGARTAVVERQHFHFSAAAIACLPASSAARSPAGFFPPASASVGLPPPPPPM